MGQAETGPTKPGIKDEITEDLEKRREELREELEEFNRERDRIRRTIGSIGGQKYSRRDNWINAVFLTVILTFFVLEITTKFLPPLISLEISVLLVSIKIVWMIHSRHRYNHFVFWILNSIEYRLNESAGQMKRIEQLLKDQ
jgi:Flp pilus assembly protein TadB